MFSKLILVKKASGLDEPYDAHKLERSLRNAGADSDLAREIVADVEASLFEGVSTKAIYQKAFKLLQKTNSKAWFRYKLKRAILQMGPAGYTFEVLIGELFAQMGYAVEVAQVLQGTCVTHEMDVIATMAQQQNLMECKYHADQGKQVSVQVPLYVRSRVDDIVKHRQSVSSYAGFEFVGWVVTNTRFSNDSINYGNGCGLKLLAWSYPEGNGLKEMLERHQVLPITILSKLSLVEKQNLMAMGIVSCRQLLRDIQSDILAQMKPSKRLSLQKELESLVHL